MSVTKSTEQQDLWLKENYLLYDDMAHLTDALNRNFGTSFEKNYIYHRTRFLELKKENKTFQPDDEQIEFIRLNYSKTPSSKFAVMFNERFKCNYSSQSIGRYARKNLLLKKETLHEWTKEEDDWISENYKHLRWKLNGKALDEAFYNRFGVNVSHRKITSRASVIGAAKKGRHWTPSEIEFLEKNFPIMPRRKLYSEYIKAFGENGVTYEAISAECIRHGIKKSRQYHRWSPEEDKWLLEHIKLPVHEKAEHFHVTYGMVKGRCNAIGAVFHGKYPIPQKCREAKAKAITKPNGYERVRSDGRTYIKIDGKFIPKQIYVYEQANGKLKEGEYLLFLDGDLSNMSLSNLGVATKRSHALMIKNGWLGKNEEIGATGLTLCNLQLTLSDTRKSIVDEDD